MDKPNVLIMTDKFAEVSRKPIEMLINAGFQVHERSYNTAGSISDEQFCELIQGIDVLVVTGSFPVSRRVIESADRLKMIAIRSSGFDGTDLDAARESGIVVTHNPGVNADSVADTAIGLMIGGIIAGAILTWVTTISELSSTIVLQTPGWSTMTVEMFQGILSDDMGMTSAFASILIVSAIVPLLIIIGRFKEEGSSLF